MIDKIPYRLAIHTTLIILSLVLVFHLLILIQVIPYSIVWAGKLKNVQEMRVFEAISLTINSVLIFFILVHSGYINMKISRKAINYILWFFIVVFSLNTVGNLFAETSFETIVFTPLTFILAILCYRVVRGNLVKS